MRPYVLASQKAVEPWVLRKAEMRMLQNIDRMVASIQEASKFLAILALLRPHLSRAEVARFIVARSSQSSARLIFDFWLSLPGLVTKSPPMLGKCALQQQDLPLEQGSICLSPHCQCASKLAHLNNAAKPEELPLISVVRASRKRKRHREIPVPVWVAYGAAIASTSQDTATEAQTPRFQVCPTPKPTGIPDMFRRKGCQVPITVYQQHADIQASLTSSLGFLKNLQENIKAALGDAGVNEHMQRLLSDACEAWDWDFLLRNKPLNRHVDAFMRLVDSLKCTLDHSAWPDEKLSANQFKALFVCLFVCCLLVCFQTHNHCKALFFCFLFVCLLIFVFYTYHFCHLSGTCGLAFADPGAKGVNLFCRMACF